MLAGMFSIPANCVTKWGKLYMNKHHKTILIPAICIAAFLPCLHVQTANGRYTAEEYSG